MVQLLRCEVPETVAVGLGDSALAARRVFRESRVGQIETRGGGGPLQDAAAVTVMVTGVVNTTVTLLANRENFAQLARALFRWNRQERPTPELGRLIRASGPGGRISAEFEQAPDEEALACLLTSVLGED